MKSGHVILICFVFVGTLLFVPGSHAQSKKPRYSKEQKKAYKLGARKKKKKERRQANNMKVVGLRKAKNNKRVKTKNVKLTGVKKKNTRNKKSTRFYGTKNNGNSYVDNTIKNTNASEKEVKHAQQIAKTKRKTNRKAKKRSKN